MAERDARNPLVIELVGPGIDVPLQAPDDLGEATHAIMIKPAEEIHLGAGPAVPRARRDPVRAPDQRNRRVVCLSAANDSSCMEEHCGRIKHAGETK